MSDEVNLSDKDKEDIAKLVVDDMMQRFQVGVGKGVLDHVWKVIVGMLIVIAIYGMAKAYHI